jgi:hypothetical protein
MTKPFAHSTLFMQNMTGSAPCGHTPCSLAIALHNSGETGGEANFRRALLWSNVAHYTHLPPRVEQ